MTHAEEIIEALLHLEFEFKRVLCYIIMIYEKNGKQMRRVHYIKFYCRQIFEYVVLKKGCKTHSVCRIFFTKQFYHCAL